MVEKQTNRISTDSEEQQQRPREKKKEKKWELPSKLFLVLTSNVEPAPNSRAKPFSIPAAPETPTIYSRFFFLTLCLLSSTTISSDATASLSFLHFNVHPNRERTLIDSLPTTVYIVYRHFFTTWTRCWGWKKISKYFTASNEFSIFFLRLSFRYSESFARVRFFEDTVDGIWEPKQM